MGLAKLLQLYKLAKNNMLLDGVWTCLVLVDIRVADIEDAGLKKPLGDQYKSFKHREKINMYHPKRLEMI